VTEFKKKLIELCKTTLRRKIELISFSMDEINTSMESETKSSVGDKHETARARMQAELEKLVWQMDELKAQYAQLEKIDPERSNEVISSQNIVVTNRATFFIAVALGKVELAGQDIYVISPDSPIAKKLLGLKVGDGLVVNDIKYVIEKIL
jgi:transcription elongation GreA/GreB family factor